MKPVLLTLMLGSLGGIIIGGLIMNWIPDRWFVKTVGFFCAVFAAQQLIKNYNAGHVPNGSQSRVSEPPARWVGFLIGIVGSAASVISHAGGIIYSIYMLRIQMAKGAFVGTIVSAFFLSARAPCGSSAVGGRRNTARLFHDISGIPLPHLFHRP
jgi:uncharacterized membrane protein YfcA